MWVDVVSRAALNMRRDESKGRTVKNTLLVGIIF